jgi:Protein of unknown function (DUF1559)
MHSYEGTHGHLPPAAVCGADGKPLLSWRVLILPFIEGEELYRQFKLNEPWDSPHNIQLLSQMPPVYEAPPWVARKMPPFHTIIHVFVGKGAAFEGTERLTLKNDFPDGTHNTIMVIEGGKPVPWTKPEDLIYDPHGPLPELKGIFKDEIRIGFASGGVTHIKSNIKEANLRAAITRNGGEKIGVYSDE